jgi:hypothetical protein
MLNENIPTGNLTTNISDDIEYSMSVETSIDEEKELEDLSKKLENLDEENGEIEGVNGVEEPIIDIEILEEIETETEKTTDIPVKDNISFENIEEANLKKYSEIETAKATNKDIIRNDSNYGTILFREEDFIREGSLYRHAILDFYDSGAVLVYYSDNPSITPERIMVYNGLEEISEKNEVTNELNDFLEIIKTNTFDENLDISQSITLNEEMLETKIYTLDGPTSIFDTYSKFDLIGFNRTSPDGILLSSLTMFLDNYITAVYDLQDSPFKSSDYPGGVMDYYNSIFSETIFKKGLETIEEIYSR